MFSLDSLTDTYFGCREAPIWLPTLFEKGTLPPCRSCTLRLNTPTHTTGIIYSDPMGITIEETTLAVLSVNGIEHNLIWTYLVIPGAHRLSGEKVADAELMALFRNPNRPDRLVYLCLPINVGNSPTNTYFSTLGKGVTGKRPALSSLFSAGASFVMYTAADVRGRNGKNPRPNAQCEPVRTRVDYYVSESPATIAAEDLVRFRQKGGKDLAGPPLPITEITPARALALCMRVRGIVIEGPESAVRSSGTGGNGYATNALKCYRLDKESDIINKQVYIGGKGKPAPTLEDELTRAAVDYDVEPETNAAIQPGDIQKYLGIILGILISLLLIAGIWWAVKHGTFNGVFNADRLYTTPTSSGSP